MITSEERNIARHCIEYAMRLGAEGIRLSLNKNEMDSCSMLNGELDKVSHSADRSIYIYLYVDGKYGTFSTNRLEEKEIENFISKAIVMVKMLGEDRCRRLPDPERTAKDACGGMELGL
jgi:PmbA protein